MGLYMNSCFVIAYAEMLFMQHASLLFIYLKVDYDQLSLATELIILCNQIVLAFNFIN